MDVVPTPFALTEGTTGLITLITPCHLEVDARFQKVGELTRVEAPEIVVSYSFDLQTNAIVATKVANASAGAAHEFCAYRLKSQAGKAVAMVSKDQILADVEKDALELEDE